MKDQRGVLYMYTLGKKRDTKKAVERAAILARLGVPHPKVVASGSPTERRNDPAARRDRRVGYVLRQWVEGIRGDDWLKAWQSMGAPTHVDAVEKLVALFDKAALGGMYIGNVNPKDLMYAEPMFRGAGSDWYIMDCGSIKELAPDAAATRYFWKLLERWGANLDRHLDALGHLFDVLSPLGRNYPVAGSAVGVDPAYAEASLAVQQDDDSSPSSGSSVDDSPSSGEIDDDDSSGSLPPDSVPPSGGSKSVPFLGGSYEILQDGTERLNGKELNEQSFDTNIQDVLSSVPVQQDDSISDDPGESREEATGLVPPEAG